VTMREVRFRKRRIQSRRAAFGHNQPFRVRGEWSLGQLNERPLSGATRTGLNVANGRNPAGEAARRTSAFGNRLRSPDDRLGSQAASLEEQIELLRRSKAAEIRTTFGG
jgi:hypothetical protein